MPLVWSYSLGKMQRLLLWSGLILLALLSCPATARLRFYQTRIIFQSTDDDMAGTQTWEVEGVATVELGVGQNGPAFSFDCNTTANNGSQIVWIREDVSSTLQLTTLTNGKRLEFGIPEYPDLGVYFCVDGSTGEQTALNITNSNPAVCAVEDTKAVVLGQSVDLEVYVAGIPPILSNWITWFGPDGNELTESTATFQDSRRRVILQNVQNSSAGIYRCQVRIPVMPAASLFLTSSDTIELEIYFPSNITQHPQNRLGVEEWTEVILSCTATGRPLPAITWEREGGEDLPVSHNTNPSETNGMVVSTLTISTVRYMDMGRYRCSADNTVTTVVHSQFAEISVIPALMLEAYVDSQLESFTDLLFVEEGSSVRIECFGSGTLEWTSSNGLDIPSDSQNQIYQEPDHSRTAQILYIQNFNVGVLSIYTCTTDLLDNTNNPVQEAVFITNSNPAVYIPEETQFVLGGTSTTITANIFAHPTDDSIQWYYGGSLVDPSADTRFSFSNDRRVLHIDNVDTSVLGTYEVVAAIGNQTARDSILLDIPDSPSASATPDTLTKNNGEPAQIQCIAGGEGTLVVVWNLDGGLDLPDGVRQSGNNLIIDSVTTSLAGTYVCSVQNLVGMATDSATLYVNDSPLARVSFQQSSSTTLSLSLMEGDTAPLFTCTSSGHPTPSITWVYEGVFSDVHAGSSLPADVILADASREQEARELQWQRPLVYTDSGMYKCTSTNAFGTSIATLNLIVQATPVINSIYPVDPVMVGQSPSAFTAYSVPTGHAGDVLTCHGFAWPPPMIEWARVDAPLPLGVSSIMTENPGGIVIARLRIDDGFSASATGQYVCMVTYMDVTDSEIIEIVEGSTVSPSPTTCPEVSSTTMLFQARVLTTNCQEWDASTMESISSSFAEDLVRVIEDDCQCSVPLGTITVDSLKCSEDITGASLFRGTIETDSVDQTEEFSCTLLAWQQRGSLVNVNGNLHEVDSACSLRVDSFTAQECVAMEINDNSFDIKLIIYIAAPVGGTLLVVIVLAIICIACYKSGRRETVTFEPDSGSRKTSLNNVSRTTFYGGATNSPSPDAETPHRISDSTEQSQVFDDVQYQAHIPYDPKLLAKEPSPEHVGLLPTSASRDRLIEMTDSGHSPNSPSPRVTLTAVQTSAQPYQLPVTSSNGSLSRVGQSSVSGSRSNSSHVSATNPMYTVDTVSDATIGSASSSNQSPSPYATAYATRTLAAASVNPTPYATMNGPVSALPPLPPLMEKEDSPILLSSHPSHRGPSVSRHPNVSGHLSPSSGSIDSVTKLSLAATPAPSVPYSEDLPPYTSRPNSSIIENRRPQPNGTPNTNSGRPWYQTDSDFSISSNSRRDDINPYATTHNSAIPYSNATSRSSLPSSRGSLPHTPRTPPVQPVRQTQIQLPQPYSQPIVRSSLSTLSTVQANRTFEMVTV